MKLQLITKPRTFPECMVVGAFTEAPIAKHPLFLLLSREDREFLTVARAQKKAWGEQAMRLLPLPSHPIKQVLLVSLGAEAEWSRQKAALAIRKILAALKERRISTALVSLDDFMVHGTPPEEMLRLLTENLLMADFTFLQYKEVPKEGWPRLHRMDIAVPRMTPKLRQALREGIVIGEAINRSRILANTPGGDMTPTKLALAAHKEKTPRLTVRALTEKQMAKLGMGGILGVARGSKEKPRLILMEYRGLPRAKSRGGKTSQKPFDSVYPERSQGAQGKPLVFVGKGVTFDTGGLNLKPDSSIYEMHMDMSGGAAVISAVSAIARLRLPINIIGIVPAVENMPSGSSYHPGDVLRTITGKTIEVLNTDAEGRIILADALGYAQRFTPKLIIDVATLTGAAMVALGQRAIALFAPTNELEKLGRDVGEASGDVVWPLPLWDDYLADIQGTFGDVANTGKTRYGGAISGAIFLKQFVGDYPWMHLDIAPTMTTIEGQFLAKGASGTGVRFLVELARRYA